MPRDQSKHTVDTTLSVELADAGPTVEVPARVSFTYHPGDPHPPRPTDLSPPDPETVEDVEIEIDTSADGDAANWHRIKDPGIEARLLRALGEDLSEHAREQRQAEYEAAREPTG
jgi:hypothetical protein